MAEQVTLPGNADESIKSLSTVLPNLPNFTIESVLGRGGMGVVYKALQRPLNRIVALKMILSGEHAGREDRSRFLTEAESIAKIHHPGIVQVFEFGSHNGFPYFAMEYVPGGTLEKKLAGQPMPAIDAAVLAERIARAIQAAHRENIVHRDLKPANILLGATGEPKVTDFGLAKTGGSNLTATGAILGTPSYMAPEQADGKKDVGPLADVYSLGAILYECLTGKPPFKGATPLDTILQVVHSEPVHVRKLNNNVPVNLETICHKCLAKAPGDRYKSMEALADDLRQFVDGKQIAASRSSLLPRRTWNTRKTIVLVLLSSALLAFGLYFLFGDRVFSRAETSSKPQPTTYTGTAGQIMKDQESAEQRVKNIRYLGTVDCHYNPEAQDEIIAILRGDRVEEVRWEAAQALSTRKCSTKKTIEALTIAITGSNRDAFPAETSERVIAQARRSLAACLKAYAKNDIDKSILARLFVLANDSEMATTHYRNIIEGTAKVERDSMDMTHLFGLYLIPSPVYWVHLTNISAHPIVEASSVTPYDLTTRALINAKMGKKAEALNDYHLLQLKNKQQQVPSYDLNLVERELGLPLSQRAKESIKPPA